VSCDGVRICNNDFNISCSISQDGGEKGEGEAET